MGAEGAASVARTVRRLLDEVDASAGDDLGKVADHLVAVMTGGGLVYVAGSGHSLVMVCEAFYRAGGLAAVRPLWHPDVLPLDDARRSTRAERTPGLGAQVVDAAGPTREDVLVVFSTSGRNPYPVEVAQAAGRRGVPVVAVTSAAASSGAAERTPTRLLDLADLVLDTRVPAGDAVYPGDDPRTSAVSTINAAYVWALLLAEIDRRAAAAGVDLPRWRSANAPGGDEANRRLFDAYAPLVPELGADGD